MNSHEILDEIAASAKQYYHELPYHNWDEHIMGCYPKAQDLCNQCEEHDINPDRFVVGAAFLLHDTGIAKPEVMKFGSHEAYSAQIADELLSQHDVTRETIEAVRTCIMGTKLGEPCPTLESKIVRRADLANVAGSYKEFVFSTFKLMEEAHKLGTVQTSFSEWRKNTRAVLNGYLAEDLVLGPFDINEDGKCQFVAQAQKNLERFAHDSSLKIINTLGQQATRFIDFLPVPRDKPTDQAAA